MTEYGAFIKIPGCRKQGLSLLLSSGVVSCWDVRAKQSSLEFEASWLLDISSEKGFVLFFKIVRN